MLWTAKLQQFTFWVLNLAALRTTSVMAHFALARWGVKYQLWEVRARIVVSYHCCKFCGYGAPTPLHGTHKWLALGYQQSVGEYQQTLVLPVIIIQDQQVSFVIKNIVVCQVNKQLHKTCVMHTQGPPAWWGTATQLHSVPTHVHMVMHCIPACSNAQKPPPEYTLSHTESPFKHFQYWAPKSLQSAAKIDYGIHFCQWT